MQKFWVWVGVMVFAVIGASPSSLGAGELRFALNWIGYMDHEKMKRTRDITLENSDLKGANVPLDELYTNDFLPGLKVR